MAELHRRFGGATIIGSTTPFSSALARNEMDLDSLLTDVDKADADKATDEFLKSGKPLETSDELFAGAADGATSTVAPTATTTSTSIPLLLLLEVLLLLKLTLLRLQSSVGTWQAVDSLQKLELLIQRTQELLIVCTMHQQGTKADWSLLCSFTRMVQRKTRQNLFLELTVRWSPNC